MKVKVDPEKLDALQSFCEESSVHGVQYLAPSRSCLGRSAWIIMMSLAFGFAGSVVSDLISNWNSHPIVTTIDTTSYPIRKIPFPAVTVCPNQQYDNWAFLQKVLNSAEANEKLVNDFWPFIERKVKQLMDNAGVFASKLDAKALKKEIRALCELSNSRQQCILMRLFYTIHKAKDFGFAREVQRKAYKALTRMHQAKNYVRFENDAYPILKQTIEDHNITCEGCYYWEDSNGNFQFPKDAQAGRELIDMIDNASDIEIKLMWETRLVIRAAARASLTFVGNLITHYSDVSYAAKYANDLLIKLNNGEVHKDGTYKGLSISWSNFQYEKLNTYAYETFRCNISHFEPTGCYQADFKTIMTVMKDNMFQPHLFDLNYLFDNNFTGDPAELDWSYPEPITENLTGYPLKTFISWKRSPAYGNLAPFAPFCQLGNKWSDPPEWGSKEDRTYTYYYKALNEFCTLFRPTMTDQGICYSFNGMRSETAFKGSQYISVFTEVFGLPHNAYPTKPFFAGGIRIQNGLRLILDAQTLTGIFKRKYRQDNTFTVSLQQYDDFPLPLMEGLEVKGGFKTSLIVTPQILEASENIIDLPIDERHCKFVTEENTLELFKAYGHKSCIFECMYNHAKKNCNCVPWNYPTFGNESDVCDIVGNVCFVYQMKNGSIFDSCECPNECVKTSYSYYTNLQKLDPADCDRDDTLHKKIKEYIETHQFEVLLKSYWDSVKSYKKDLEYAPSFDCKERLVKDIAIVDIYFGSASATRLQKSLTATFTDKLSSIGGTLGLFGGVSILSIAELLAFCLRGLQVWFKDCSKNKGPP